MTEYNQLLQNGEYKRLLELAEQDHSLEGKFWTMTALWKLGNVDEAYNFATDYELHEIDQLQPDEKGVIVHAIGAIHAQKGDLEAALDYYDESLRLNRQVGNVKVIAASLNNSGGIHYLKGDYDAALKFYQQSLELFKKIEYSQGISYGYGNIGEVYHKKGELDLAINCYEKCHQFNLESNNPQDLATSNYYLAKSLIAKGHRDRAEVHLRNLQQLAIDHSEDKVVQLLDNYCQAIYLKTSNRQSDKIGSSEIFEQIIDTNDFHFEILIYSLYHLVELLIYEYKSYGQKIVLQEILKYIEKMTHIAESQNMVATLFDVMILKSRIAIIENEYDKAYSTLENAIQRAEEMTMTTYINRLGLEKTKLETDLYNLKQSIDSSSIASRLEQSQIFDYIKKVQNLTQNH